MVSCEKRTNEIAQAILEPNEIIIAELKTAKVEQMRCKLARYKEENGVVALRRLWLKKMIDATGGDVFLESTQRSNALDAKLHGFHRECGKITIEWFINRTRVGAIDRLAAKLDLFSNEYATLLGEYVMSAAKLCTKKMILGAFMIKLEKRTILEHEIARAKKMRKEHVNILVKNLDDEPTEIAARGKLDIDLWDERVRNINELKASAFVKGSLRVLTEMLKGVNCGEKHDPRVDEAIALADVWTTDMIDMCVVKVCVGVLVDKLSIYQVLKSQIIENQKIEKEVNDRLVMYKRKDAHRAQGFGMSHFAVGAVVGIITALAKGKGKGKGKGKD